MFVRGLVRGMLLLAVGTGIIGCESNAGTGALVGGAGGAAVGGAIGSMSHARAGEGALIGAAVGALGGALVGHQMDKNDENAVRQRYAERDYDRRHAAMGEPVTKSDVVSWTRRGTSEELIIDRIQRSGCVFHLTAADENDLRDRRVSESVIMAMKQTALR